VAPAGGEHLRAGAVFGGEKRDDVAENAVGEDADPIGEALFQPLLLRSGEHPHGDGGARRRRRRGGRSGRRGCDTPTPGF